MKPFTFQNWSFFYLTFTVKKLSHSTCKKMTHCQDWDIDNYKSEHEPKHHWALKKAFIEFHKDRFPEHELVGLQTRLYILHK